jgi:hypothetical protein
VDLVENTRLHLLGSLVGEGYGQDMTICVLVKAATDSVGLVAKHVEYVFVGKAIGLSRTGTCIQNKGFCVAIHLIDKDNDFIVKSNVLRQIFCLKTQKVWTQKAWEWSQIYFFGHDSWLFAKKALSFLLEIKEVDYEV